jgi:hypothetical protein
MVTEIIRTSRKNTRVKEIRYMAKINAENCEVIEKFPVVI